MKKRAILFLPLLVIVSFMLSSSFKCTHTFESWTTKLLPTCTNEGIRFSKCTFCNDISAEIIPATGHKEGNWIITLDATCTENGLSQVFCEVCHEILNSKTIFAIGHKEDDWEILNEPSCIETGLRQISCAICDEVLKTESIPAIGHNKGKWVVISNPSCINDGMEQVFCTICNEIIDKRAIPATGHTKSEWKTVSEPTCTDKGICQIFCTSCKEILQEKSIPELGHKRSDWNTVIYPTCIKNGLKQITCVHCKKIFEESSIPATGHSYSSHVCIRCGSFDSSYENKPFINNPNGYQLQTVNTTVLTGGSYNLKQGIMGYRVRCVQRYLGQQEYKYGMYDYTTTALVKAFQEKNGLDVTGEVDISTWIAMGFTEDEWVTWDTYVHPSEINEDMTRSEIIDKFIEIAYTYLGAEYIYGCAGTPEQGGDCSGFVLSCLYGIGINPEGYDSQQHNFNEYNSRLMWTEDHFKKVSLKEIQVGDLVFYQNSDGIIIHVAIYIGDNLCIESCRSTIEVMSLYKYSMSIAGVKRVLYY